MNLMTDSFVNIRLTPHFSLGVSEVEVALILPFLKFIIFDACLLINHILNRI